MFFTWVNWPGKLILAEIYLPLPMFIVRPRLFISYAREDIAYAEALHEHLQAAYTVFFDKKKILIGDPFPEQIRKHIRQCDGCIALISPDSIVSEWCKLEIYFAHLLNKTIIPIKIGETDFETSSPLAYFQKGINYTIVSGLQQLPESFTLIDERLRITRRSALQRSMRVCAAVLLVVVAGALVFNAAIHRINGLQYERDRDALLTKLRQSTTIWRDSTLSGACPSVSERSRAGGRTRAAGIERGSVWTCEAECQIVVCPFAEKFQSGQKTILSSDRLEIVQSGKCRAGECQLCERACFPDGVSYRRILGCLFQGDGFRESGDRVEWAPFFQLRF